MLQMNDRVSGSPAFLNTPWDSVSPHPPMPSSPSLLSTFLSSSSSCRGLLHRVGIEVLIIGREIVAFASGSPEFAWDYASIASNFVCGQKGLDIPALMMQVPDKLLID